MTLPASIAIQTKFNLSQYPHKFNLSVLTDFESEAIDFSYVRGNFKIVNPIGITTYDNTSLVTPDVYYFSISTITRSGQTATVVTTSAHGLVTGDTVRIGYATQSQYNGMFVVTVLTATSFTYTVVGSPATPATGTPQGLRISLNSVQMADDIATGMPYTGAYTITCTLDISNGAQEGIYAKDFVYGYSYQRPTVAISQSINVFLPRVYSTDNTIYTVNGIVPTWLRTHTINYPSASGFSPTTTSNQTDEVNPPRVWNGIYTTDVLSFVTYTQDDGLVIYDRVAGSDSKEFIADVDLCSVNCCLNNLNNQYTNLVGKNNTLAGEIQVKLNRALQLKQLYLGNIQCGNSEAAASNLKDFYCLTGCTDDCGCGEPTGPIAPYGGYVGSTILEYDSEIPFFAGQYVNYNSSLYKVISNTTAGENPDNTPSKYVLISAGSLIGGTWAEISALKTANGLVVGMKYLITDFETIYDRPDYEDASIPKAVIDTIYSGIIEPLILTAVSANEFNVQALSVLYPNDYIEYRFDYTTFVNSAATKGKITLRRDTSKLLEAEFDWRSITYKRYNHSDGRGYLYYYDNGGNDFQLIGLFNDPDNNDTVYNNICKGFSDSVVSSNALPFDLPNNVIGDTYSYENEFISCFNNTSKGGAFSNNILDKNCNSNVFFGFTFKVFLGYNCQGNDLTEASFIEFRSVCSFNILKSGCSLNVFMGSNSNITLSNDARFNIFGVNYSSVDLSSATHVYGGYQCSISLASDGLYYLQYFNGTSILNVSPTS